MANIEIANFPQIVALANKGLFADFSGFNIYSAYWNKDSIGDETTNPTSYRAVSFANNNPTQQHGIGKGVVFDPSMGVQPIIQSCRYSMCIMSFQASITAAMQEYISTASIILQTRTLDSQGNEVSHNNMQRFRGNGWTAGRYNHVMLMGSSGNLQKKTAKDNTIVWSLMAQNGIRIHDLSMFVLTWD